MMADSPCSIGAFGGPKGLDGCHRCPARCKRGIATVARGIVERLTYLGGGGDLGG